MNIYVVIYAILFTIAGNSTHTTKHTMNKQEENKFSEQKRKKEQTNKQKEKRTNKSLKVLLINVALLRKYLGSVNYNSEVDNTVKPVLCFLLFVFNTQLSKCLRISCH